MQTETFSTKTHPDMPLLLSSLIHDQESGTVTILALNRSATDEMQLDVELRGLGDAQPHHGAEGEGDAALHRERRVTAGEDQP